MKSEKISEIGQGLRFYGLSKSGIWGFCVLQVCVRRRPGANADVMSWWEGKLHATSKTMHAKVCCECCFENPDTFSPNLCVETACWLDVAMYQVMRDVKRFIRY